MENVMLTEQETNQIANAKPVAKIAAEDVNENSILAVFDKILAGE